MKPIKVIKTNGITLWNANDGTEQYSRDIIALLDHLKAWYILERQEEK